MGVLGGTFNPVHLGHLRLAEEAVEALRLERCLLVPAWVPPHKSGSNLAPYSSRYRMLELAIVDHPRFQVSDLERRLSGTSYTVTTLRQLVRELEAPVELYFLLGLDAFLEIHGWWHFRELFERATLTIFPRPGCSRQAIGEHLTRYVSARYLWNEQLDRFTHPDLRPVMVLRSTFLDISSSAIRSLLAAGKSIRYLVPEPVLGYIEAAGLYRDPGHHLGNRKGAV